MPRDSDPTNATLRWSLLLVIYGMQLQPINFTGVDISDSYKKKKKEWTFLMIKIQLYGCISLIEIDK